MYSNEIQTVIMLDVLLKLISHFFVTCSAVSCVTRKLLSFTFCSFVSLQRSFINLSVRFFVIEVVPVFRPLFLATRTTPL